MSAFEIRPERPPPSPFCLEVYIFALSSLEEVIHKRPLWLLVEIQKMMAGAPIAPETLTTKRQGAKSRDGREQDLFAKVYFCAQNDWRARGRRAKLKSNGKS